MAPIDSLARKPLAAAAAELLVRTPPHSIEAEQGLLGAILINNEAFFRVSEFLEPKHFFEPIHQRIFELAGEFIRLGKVANPVTLKTFLPADLDIAGLSLNQYLAKLAAESTTIINAEDYGRLVYDLSIRRDLIQIGEEMVNTAYDAAVDATPSSHIEDAERKLYQLAETGRYDSGFQPFAKVLTAAVDMAARAYQRDGSLSGLATGLIDLDAKMGGLQHSDLIILAGRPGMGKTALATNIAYNVAKAFTPGDVRPDGHTETLNGGIVGFFSLEMSAEQLGTRIIAEQTKIPSNKIRRGGIEEVDFDTISNVAIELQKLPFYIDETGGLSIGQLAARARRLKRQHGLDLLVVDYLQLLQGSGRFSDSRVQEITDITTRLKALAKELKVPILALSQLSRQVEQRDDKRPQLSDLRESGSIEQDADVVLFVFREEYYHQMRKPSETNREKFAEWLAEGERVEGRAEVIIGKQRHGPTGTVELQFDAAVTRFANLADSERVESYIPIGSSTAKQLAAPQTKG
jgi:replicative DNA helicase